MSTLRDRSILDKSCKEQALFPVRQRGADAATRLLGMLVVSAGRTGAGSQPCTEGGWIPFACPQLHSPFMQVLDPSWEGSPPPLTVAPRLAGLEGIDVALLSNGKAGVEPLFNHVETLLRNRWGAASVERATKGNYSAPAEPDLVRRLARRRLVITGVGD